MADASLTKLIFASAGLACHGFQLDREEGAHCTWRNFDTEGLDTVQR